jgi:SAM-dependent methyltransferase
MTPSASTAAATAAPAAGFSPEWEQTYRDSAHLSIWPWSDLVSLTHRHASPRQGFQRVLELGVGAGANVPFFQRLRCDFHGIEGSASIVERLREAFPDLAEQLICGDFTRALPWADASFDLVVDRASITHNDTPAVRATLSEAARVLRLGGRFIGIDWFSTEHEDAGGGTAVDAHTRYGIDSRNFSGLGRVHFSDEAHLRDLFEPAGFAFEVLQHKVHCHLVGGNLAHFASWNLVAVRAGAPGTAVALN